MKKLPAHSDVDDVDENGYVDDHEHVDEDDAYDAAEYEYVEDEPRPRSLGIVLLIGGILGFFAAFMLTFEEFELLKDPTYTPTCSVDSTISCGSVMLSDQGSVFGFPNPMIGLAAFPIVILSGALALSRARLPSWFWRWLLAGSLFGLMFVAWLITQALYEIRALCPYCMIVWAGVIPVFWRVLGYSLSSGQFGDDLIDRPAVQFLERRWWIPTLLSYALVIALVLTAFSYYFF